MPIVKLDENDLHVWHDVQKWIEVIRKKQFVLDYDLNLGNKVHIYFIKKKISEVYVLFELLVRLLMPQSFRHMMRLL